MTIFIYLVTITEDMPTLNTHRDIPVLTGVSWNLSVHRKCVISNYTISFMTLNIYSAVPRQVVYIVACQ